MSDTRYSRRSALALLFGAAPLLSRAADVSAPPIRLALSESLVSGVNLNDARAAMQVWLKQMSQDLKITVEVNPRIFDSNEEIARRARLYQFDAVALNTLEYRQIAEYLDPSQIIAEGGAAGQVQYLLLAKAGAPANRLADLRGRRLMTLDNSRMCVASAWLSTLLAEAHLGPTDQFFGSIAADPKPSRVILPVFFGQADVCLTSRSAFDTMIELNPQVGKQLTVVASSPLLVAAFYAFHKDYHSATRDRLASVYVNLPGGAAARQIATLFQFDRLASRDAGFLAPTLSILETADRLRRQALTGVRK